MKTYFVSVYSAEITNIDSISNIFFVKALIEDDIYGFKEEGLPVPIQACSQDCFTNENYYSWTLQLTFEEEIAMRGLMKVITKNIIKASHEELLKKCSFCVHPSKYNKERRRKVYVLDQQDYFSKGFIDSTLMPFEVYFKQAGKFSEKIFGVKNVENTEVFLSVSGMVKCLKKARLEKWSDFNELAFNGEPEFEVRSNIVERLSLPL